MAIPPPPPAIFGVGGVVRQKGFPLLGPSGFPSWGGLSLLSSPCWRGRGIFFSLLKFSEAGGALEPSGKSDDTGRRELLRVPVAFSLAFFSGTTWGAGTSSFTKCASTGPSGKGAGQSNCPDVLFQSCQRNGSLDPT